MNRPPIHPTLSRVATVFRGTSARIRSPISKTVSAAFSGLLLWSCGAPLEQVSFNQAHTVPPQPVATALSVRSESRSEAKEVNRQAWGVRTPLAQFFLALRGLESNVRKDHVRILWFGDSHTAADFLTGRLRTQMQRQFGNGGPGFVRIGAKHSRHDDVENQRQGRWLQRPRSPASHRVEEQGVLGVSGIKVRPRDGSASARVRARERRGLQQLDWSLVFRPLSERVRFSVQLGNQINNLDLRDFGQSASGASVSVRGSQLLGLQLKGSAKSVLRVYGFRGQVELFGVYLENDKPGVILDSMGINGARARTHEAWHQGVFWGEVAERDPQLIVLAYGTNELGDTKPVHEFFTYYESFLQQARAVVPRADCLLVGPTDRLGRSGKSMQRARLMDEAQADFAARLGCEYFSLFQQMQRQGGYSGWAKLRPPLAAQDGVHLKFEGYRQLADSLFERLMAGYSEASEPASSSAPASTAGATSPPRSK